MISQIETTETLEFIPGNITHEITEGFNPQFDVSQGHRTLRYRVSAGYGDPVALLKWNGLKPIVFTKSESTHFRTQDIIILKSFLTTS